MVTRWNSCSAWSACIALLYLAIVKELLFAAVEYSHPLFVITIQPMKLCVVYFRSGEVGEDGDDLCLPASNITSRLQLPGTISVQRFV